ncbi:MAG: cytochrome c biogenesis protein [Planctomycetota bacterium]|jgi:heme exporter protein C
MRRFLMLLTFALLVGSTWMAFTLGEVVAAEKNITVEKNIIYVHVPSAICASLCFVVLLVAGIGYLRTSKPIWDYVGAASAEVGFVFATVLNATGSIFGRALWGTWWTASPRLISSAVLWFLCVAYIILRASIQGPQRRARICAVFGIIAFLDVPMLFLTARLIKDMHIANVSFESPWQGTSFALSILATFLLAALLICLRTDILKCKAELENKFAY